MPVIVIAAADQLVLDDAVESRIPPGSACRIFHCADLDSETVFSHLGTPDLFADSQCFHYAGIGGLKLRKAEADGVDRLLSNLPANIRLLCSELIEEDFKSKQTKKLNSAEIRRFSKHGELVDLLRVSEPRHAVDWLKRRAHERHGIALSKAQAERLYHTCGASISLAGVELKKLEMLKPGDQAVPVTDKMLASVLSASPEARFYVVAEQLLSGAPDALRQLRDWYSADVGAFRMVYELSRRLLGLKALREGRSVQPPFFERQLKSLDHRFAGQRLDRAISACASLEHGLKCGAYIAESREKAELAALELFQAEINALQRA